MHILLNYIKYHAYSSHIHTSSDTNTLFQMHPQQPCWHTHLQRQTQISSQTAAHILWQTERAHTHAHTEVAAGCVMQHSSSGRGNKAKHQLASLACVSYQFTQLSCLAVTMETTSQQQQQPQQQPLLCWSVTHFSHAPIIISNKRVCVCPNDVSFPLCMRQLGSAQSDREEEKQEFIVLNTNRSSQSAFP